MKKNFLFGLIGAGALILSGSVGFAAWTIKNGSDSKTDTSLKLSADATVNDERIKLDQNECKWFDSVVEFKPVVDSSKHYAHSWLSVSDQLKAENLTATYVVKGTATKGTQLNITADFTDETKPGTDTIAYADIVKLGAKDTNKTGVVGNLPDAVISSGDSGQSSTIIVGDNGAFSANISVTFAWGDAFGGQNPYEYYNNQDYSEPLANEAKANIEHLKYLPNCSFKLVVTVTASN